MAQETIKTSIAVYLNTKKMLDNLRVGDESYNSALQRILPGLINNKNK